MTAEDNIIVHQETNIDENVRFCSKCSKTQEFKEVTYSEERHIDYRHEENDDETYNFVKEEQVWVSSILRCPKCTHTILKKYWQIKGENDKNDLQFLPFEQPWQQKPMENPSEMIPAGLYKLYQECIEAFNMQLSVGAGMLVRVLLEKICVDQGLDQKNLIQKISALPIEQDYKDALHEIRELGNKSAHEAYKPKRKELSLSLFLLEVLLLDFYQKKLIKEKIRNSKHDLANLRSTRR